MPNVEIPSANLAHLGLFGYDLLVDEGDYAWYSSPRGRMRVKKARPFIWVDDVSDAIQLGAIGILMDDPSDGGD